MSWKDISIAAQAEILQSIPQKWKLEADAYKDLTDVSRVPHECGLLTEKQLQITELNVTELVDRIKSRKLKAVEIVEAIAGRAAISHQLVTPLFLPVNNMVADILGQLSDRVVSGRGPRTGQSLG